LKILHVTGDWKWTGPAGPMLELLLEQRRSGSSVDLACPEPEPSASTSLLQCAEAAGVTPVLTLTRGRGVSPWRDREDARRLAQLVSKRDFEIVHTWHTRDHVLAIRALGGRRRRRLTRVVRSYRNAESIRAWPWNRWLFGPGTDALLCVSPETADLNASIRRGRPVRGEFGAVDLARFAPLPRDTAVRRSLDLQEEDLVIGIVARVQHKRRFDLLLAAMQRLVTRQPRARLLVIGRGTHLDEVGRMAAQKLGIADRVRFAGYLGAAYADALRAANIFTFLVPGSDGSCRALLEAAACGLPAVVTRRGSLAEIVVDGETGLVVDENPESLADAWRRLLEEPTLVSQMGAAARIRAERLFAPAHFADTVAALYADAASGPISRYPRSQRTPM
jgi:glycosyltransferase involved in cell wall biosynthesis